MSNVVNIKPNSNVVEGLRNIADQLEADGDQDFSCTLIIGSNVYHLGCVNDEQAASEAIFNMTFGIQKMMQPVVDMSLEDNV